MSLRCSLLGHSYGEAEIEREREEQGSEVVVTVREFEECKRCGQENIITENKEVTALRSSAPDLESAETDADLGGSSDATNSGRAPGTADVSDSATPDVRDSAATNVRDSAATSASDSADPDVTPDDGGAEIISDSTGGAGSNDSGEADPASASAGGLDDSSTATAGNDIADSSSAPANDTDDSPAAADDDGVILDEEDSTVGEEDRRPGEWPDAETTHPAEANDEGYTDWPEVEGADDGFDAEPGSESSDVEFGGGLTPESAPEVEEDEADEVEFINAEGDTLQARDGGTNDVELSSGISAGAEAPSLSGPAEDPAVDAEFVCPECDHREEVAGSSLRAGDICPECSRGYLARQ